MMIRKVFITIIAFLLMQSLHAQHIVDTHAHFIPQSYRSFLAQHDALFSEDFPIPQWDLKQHIQFMDEAGITQSVLTLPAPQPWFGDTEEGAAFVRKTNEEMAELKKQYPDRFLFCATLPLPDVEAAVREAIYCLDSLHADGVKLASNSYGQYLGDPAPGTPDEGYE